MKPSILPLVCCDTIATPTPLALTSARGLLLLLAVLMLVPLSLHAQDASEIVGYTNVYIKISAYPDAGGSVAPAQKATDLKIYRSSWDYKASVPVASLMGVNIVSYLVYCQPADGYVFAGWYEDTNGNGQLDIYDDQLLSTDTELLEMPVLEDDATIYTTQAEAQAAAKPATPQRTLFAHFSKGATVDVAYRQGEGVANCGMVTIDKPVNNPGDQVTVRAYANDGFQFEYWEDAPLMGNVVSREAAYTFTVQGGEKLYAYFTATDAPVAELPADGGFKVLVVGSPWVLSEEAMKSGAHVIVMEKDDYVSQNGKTYLDMSKDDCQIDVAQTGGLPTIVSGRGTVRFAYKDIVGYAREASTNALVRYSGNLGTTVSGENIYVYLFHEDLGAFVEHANSDQMLNPGSSTRLSVPARRAYIAMSAFDIVDNQGNIPTVIGLSPDTFDRAVSGIDGVRIDSRDIQGSKVYTLSGVQVQATSQPGVYIVNGRKVVVK